MANINPFYVVYDAGSDVLYISRRREPATRGVEDPHGIVWRYGGDGELIGATVLDFNDYWSDRRPALAEELSRHFHVSAPQAMGAVERAISGRER